MKFVSALVALVLLSNSEARLRELQGACPGTVQLSVSSCDYESLKAALADSTSCTAEETLALLGDSEMVDSKCEAAYSDAKSLPFSEVLNKGYQYDREFFNGGTDLNSFESSTVDHAKDTERLSVIGTELLGDTVIEWPDYLANFQECHHRAAMCCWTADKYNVGGGSCTSAGCADGDPLDNTDVCHVDMKNSPLAAHTRDGVAVFPGDAEGPVHCQGFAWDEKDEMFRGNALFHVVMKGLLSNGYTRNVPGAPMCGCVEQMPVVSHAVCSNTDVNLQVTLVKELEEELRIYIGGKNISFGNCDGKDLADYHADRGLEKFVVGDCSSGYGLERSIYLAGLVKKD
uniref:Uncharacterized protein n=1 Tax=Helicotheca tamesis TaxID=374047 RepID=A0A7S2I1I6_9STRA|mmetsp:Transcript_4770/g.6506  ORF Transcript_4770/g.6506 Transcript_4770/m.6506 type:complete len:344 (+) Transcript_4770:73-1104(+)